MARAGVASASAQSDSIKGLAQSIAKPTYRRLLNAEPLLRRAVPGLIIAFLITICIGAIVQVLDHRRQTLSEHAATLEAAADLVAEQLNVRDKAAPAHPLTALPAALPRWATEGGRRFILTDGEGLVTATAPMLPGAIGRRLVALLGPTQPLTTFGASAGVLEITLPTGTRALATVRTLNAPFGQLAVIEPRADALAGWQSLTTLTVTLSATTGFVVLILGFAFHWQATRAREADVIYETVRSRIDTALNRGRCGLWDWDLARGRVFWSQSMFEILGMHGRDDLLSFGEVSTLVHPEDVQLYELATRLADSRVTSIDHAFRMRHANGHWVWLRARCELVPQPHDTGLHLIGIAVDITEQKGLVERSAAADMRLRDAIETIPEAFVLWDADNRLVLCNSNFQELHDLPDEAITVGASYESVVAAGRQPVVRNKVVSADPSQPGARTFEAQLEARARHLSEELRCMVCQNQSIDDSEAPLAHDLRVLVRQRLEAGDTDRQVLDYLVSRYGDFVLLKPPFKADTLLLWGLPPLALIAGIAALVIMARKRKSVALQPEALSQEEQTKLATLVGPDGSKH
jgi:two-component system cell cycle sensor histidine kinase PleC